jgi:aerobic carbon-monoxide dehydrogenase large subunit
VRIAEVDLHIGGDGEVLVSRHFATAVPSERAQGVGPALYEEIGYHEDGNVYGGSFLDYYVPTALECPSWETDKTVTPSPHHPLGAKGVGESAAVGAPPAIANAVVDALSHLGVTHVDIPITPEKVWQLLRKAGVAE